MEFYYKLKDIPLIRIKTETDERDRLHYSNLYYKIDVLQIKPVLYFGALWRNIK
jgi:hypothetical protein